MINYIYNLIFFGIFFFRFSTYVIDEIAKKAGKSILRLPPYHCELNPIELVWSMVKQHVNNTTFETADMQLLHQTLDRVKPEDWQNFISRVKEEEKKFWDLDFISEELIDELQTDLDHDLTNGDTSNSSDDDGGGDICYYPSK